MTKANQKWQKQIRNGNSQLVIVESKFVTQKQSAKQQSAKQTAKCQTAKCQTAKCQTADEHRKSFKTKAKSIVTKAITKQNQWGKVLSRKSKKLTIKANQLLCGNFSRQKSKLVRHKSKSLSRRSQKQQLVPSLPLDPFRRPGCNIAWKFSELDSYSWLC